MPLESDRQVLVDAAAALGIPINTGQIEQLLAYRDLLLKWNKVYNLTAVRDPQAMLVQHLVDSLAVVKPLSRWLADRSPNHAARMLDVGSGAGLPGIVFAILLPQLSVTCVDTVGKKASFMRQAAAELQLSALRAEHARVEDLQLPPFDIITSRAFASLGDFTQLTRFQLAPGGVWMAMKGKRPDAEIAALAQDIEVFHVEPLQVPGLEAERCIVWLRARSTPGGR